MLKMAAEGLLIMDIILIYLNTKPLYVENYHFPRLSWYTLNSTLSPRLLGERVEFGAYQERRGKTLIFDV
jgi:hypothetical protein